MTIYHLTRISGNSKTGPIPVATTSRDTCPSSCPLKGNGCYAETGPLKLHWDKVSQGLRGVDLEQFCNEIRALPKHQLWRLGQAGDLPGANGLIDANALSQIVDANQGRRGFGMTHYDPSVPENAAAIAAANSNGLTINLSANNQSHADKLYALGVGPVVTVLPKGTTKYSRTPANNFIAVCPATQNKDITCANCGICAIPTRKAIIGFPAHGTQAKRAHVIAISKE